MGCSSSVECALPMPPALRAALDDEESSYGQVGAEPGPLRQRACLASQHMRLRILDKFAFDEVEVEQMAARDLQAFKDSDRRRVGAWVDSLPVVPLECWSNASCPSTAGDIMTSFGSAQSKVSSTACLTAEGSEEDFEAAASPASHATARPASPKGVSVVELYTHDKLLMRDGAATPSDLYSAEMNSVGASPALAPRAPSPPLTTRPHARSRPGSRSDPALAPPPKAFNRPRADAALVHRSNTAPVRLGESCL
eukprot:TRINITY_DN28847_c0_g1_i1.p2 TRINITY_DN28847_c0_g1~~TRINITY_DN28847_c0_g1_i1.p2  ORF type:complete len:253 (+),score=78.24 TRINITY_DN28847_c0_g1_i1:63-821(+)